jgi:hypothetical protein
LDFSENLSERLVAQKLIGLFARSALGLNPECYTGATSTDYGSKRLEAL